MIIFDQLTRTRINLLGRLKLFESILKLVKMKTDQDQTSNHEFSELIYHGRSGLIAWFWWSILALRTFVDVVYPVKDVG